MKDKYGHVVISVVLNLSYNSGKLYEASCLTRSKLKCGVTIWMNSE